MTHSPSQSKWNCKYHAVFAPKDQWQVFYGKKRYEIGQILRELCQWKGVALLEAEACPLCTSAIGNSPQDEYIEFRGVSQRKK